MTLNGVMTLILRFFFTEFGIASGAHCVKVVEDVVVKKFTFVILSPGEFLVLHAKSLLSTPNNEPLILYCAQVNFHLYTLFGMQHQYDDRMIDQCATGAVV